MSNTPVTLVSANELIVFIHTKSFEKAKKAGLKISESDKTSITRRVRAVLSRAGFEGRFGVGFVQHIRGSSGSEGKIHFSGFSLEHRCVHLYAQLGGNDSRMELFLNTPDAMDGDLFLKKIQEAHQIVEPEGRELPRARKSFVISEEGGEALGSRSLEEHKGGAPVMVNQKGADAEKPVPATDEYSSLPKGAAFLGEASSIRDRLFNLVRVYDGLKVREERRMALKERRAQIAETLDQLAEEDSELQRELKELDAATPSSEQVEDILRQLEVLHKKNEEEP